jgi:hypothetical protein
MRSGWSETGGIHEQYLVLILRLNAKPGNRKCDCPQQKSITKNTFLAFLIDETGIRTNAMLINSYLFQYVM